MMRTMSRLPVAAAFLCTAFASPPAASAQRPAARSCDAKLTSPSSDSLVLQLTVRAAAFDTTHPLSPRYADFIAQGVRQFTRFERPLSLTVYDGRHADAWPTASAIFRISVRRDGRLGAPRAAGGTRTEELDRATLAALATLDTSGLLPAPDSASIGSADSLDVRIVIAPTSQWETTLKHTEQDGPGSTPLVQLRVPVRHFAQQAAPFAGNRAPRYPDDMRAANVEGEVQARFVVRPDSTVDMRTLAFVRATSVSFAQAVLTSLRDMRFFPAVIDGCPVASVVQMPFQFGLSR